MNSADTLTSNIFKTVRNLVVTVRAICCKAKKFHILPAECICVLSVIPTVNSLNWLVVVIDMVYSVRQDLNLCIHFR
jgi:hypothetical protein